MAETHREKAISQKHSLVWHTCKPRYTEDSGNYNMLRDTKRELPFHLLQKVWPYPILNADFYEVYNWINVVLGSPSWNWCLSNSEGNYISDMSQRSPISFIFP